MVPVVSAVTIQGTVYDFDLSVRTDAVVEINTTPHQKIVAKDGSFSFDVPRGRYVLKASAKDGRVEENISAMSEGTYRLDLILFPSVDEELLEEMPDVPEIEGVVQDRPASHWFWWAIVFAVLGFFVYRVTRRKPEPVRKEVPVSDELDRVMALLAKEGGRMTQKELRKRLPYSEAKVSLMLDELEERGLIKRIKKGRGNVIIRV